MSPVTISGDEPPVAVNPPGLDVTVYEVILDPPLFPGAEKVIVAWPLPRVAVPIVGASGVVAGVTALDALDALLVPAAFVAVTVNVYVVPFVRPVMTIGEDPADAVNPPGLDVTVYEVILDPPLFPGAEKVIVATPLLAVATPIVGASGTFDGMTILLGDDAFPVPAAFVAVTVNV